MRRHQLFAGFVLILAAAFVRHAPACGLLGAWTAERLHTLLGSYGTTLLVVALVGAAMVVAAPRVIGNIILTAGKLVRRTASTLASRALAKSRKRRLGASHQARFQNPNYRPAPTSVPPRPPLPREDGLRTGLKNLGYTAAEIASVLPRLDGAAGFQGMALQAIRLLRSPA